MIIVDSPNTNNMLISLCIVLDIIIIDNTITIVYVYI